VAIKANCFAGIALTEDQPMGATWLVMLPALIGQAEGPIKVEQTDTFVQFDMVGVQVCIKLSG
jgi:hypothetical protein